MVLQFPTNEFNADCWLFPNTFLAKMWNHHCTAKDSVTPDHLIRCILCSRAHLVLSFTQTACIFFAVCACVYNYNHSAAFKLIYRRIMGTKNRISHDPTNTTWWANQGTPRRGPTDYLWGYSTWLWFGLAKHVHVSQAQFYISTVRSFSTRSVTDSVIYMQIIGRCMSAASIKVDLSLGFAHSNRFIAQFACQIIKIATNASRPQYSPSTDSLGIH